MTGRSAVSVAVVTVFLLLGLDAGAQRGAPPPVQAPAGTGAIGGVVTSTGRPAQPIRRAIVSLDDGNGLAVSVVSGDDGGFRFENLAPGRYSLNAEKAAYLKTAYGARRPGGRGTPVALAVDQQVGGLTLPMPLGAVIEGTIRDATGAPAQGVGVAVVRTDRLRSTNGSTNRRDTVSTDDLGAYRAYGLEPGDYVVAAVPRLGGRPLVTRPPQEVETLIRRLETGNAAAAAASASAPALFAEAPIYYPDTVTAEDAGRLRLVPGQVRSGVDIVLHPVPAVSVAGTVGRFDGGPIGQVRVGDLLSLGLAISPLAGPRLTTRPNDSGSDFGFTGVTPGRYTAHASVTTSSPAGDIPYWAMATVDVRDVDVSGVLLMLRPALTVSGHVVFERGRVPAPADLSQVRVGMIRTEPIPDEPPSPFALLPTPTAATATRDGAFQVTGVMPGRYAPAAGVPGWWLKSAMLGDRDLLDLPLELDEHATDVEGITLTFSTRRSQLSGALQSSTGDPAPGYYVLVFPTDRALWRTGARRIRVVRPATDGRYVIPDLPAGQYFVAALTDLDDDLLNDPTYLDQVAPLSATVTIADGQQAVQDFRIG